MKKQSAQSTETSANEDLEVVVIKKSNGVCSQEIRMKLPPETTFGSIIKFMQEQDLLKTKNAIVRPAHNESHVIGQNRKIQ